MQVDPAPALASMERVDKSSSEATSTSTSNARKYSPPLDAQSGDLIPEGVVYLRLLLVLMNLDAGKVEEVCSLS
jgi:26S proteasome regulatory subunit N3